MKDGLGSEKSWPSRVGKIFFVTSPFMDAVRFGHRPRALNMLNSGFDYREKLGRRAAGRTAPVEILWPPKLYRGSAE